jgi:hypothetical protein
MSKGSEMKESILSYNVEGGDWQIRDHQNRRAWSYLIDIIPRFSFKFFKGHCIDFTDTWQLPEA